MKKLYYFLIKTLLCILLFLILGITCKKNIQYKYFIQQKIYQDHLSFASFKKFYNQYLGGIFPLEHLEKGLDYVFHEEINYQNLAPYKDGVKLEVNNNYLIPIMEDGIVVYTGDKEDYGYVVIIENDQGIDTWYGNICNPLVKLYDQVKSGDYIGESCNNEFYLVYTKGNEILNYQDYLS